MANSTFQKPIKPSGGYNGIKKFFGEVAQMIVENNASLISNQAFLKMRVGTKSILDDWKDYRWQLKNSIKTIEAFEEATGIRFSDEEYGKLEKTIQKFPLSITPYYVSLIEKENYRNDPIFKQAFPDPAELIVSKCDMKDPLHEDIDSPTNGITHRYPDRVLFLVSNCCAIYCRHCH